MTMQYAIYVTQTVRFPIFYLMFNIDELFLSLL